MKSPKLRWFSVTGGNKNSCLFWQRKTKYHDVSVFHYCASLIETVCIDTPLPAVSTSEVTCAGVHSSSTSSRCKLTSSKCCCTSHSVVIFVFHKWEMMLTWLKVFFFFYWSWVDGRCTCIVPDSRLHAPESHILIKWDLWRVQAASFVIFWFRKFSKDGAKKKISCNLHCLNIRLTAAEGCCDQILIAWRQSDIREVILILKWSWCYLLFAEQPSRRLHTHSLSPIL